jgi:hypothetical protein
VAGRLELVRTRKQAIIQPTCPLPVYSLDLNWLSSIELRAGEEGLLYIRITGPLTLEIAGKVLALDSTKLGSLEPLKELTCDCSITSVSIDLERGVLRADLSQNRSLYAEAESAFWMIETPILEAESTAVGYIWSSTH